MEFCGVEGFFAVLEDDFFEVEAEFVGGLPVGEGVAEELGFEEEEVRQAELAVGVCGLLELVDIQGHIVEILGFVGFYDEMVKEMWVSLLF